MHIYKKIKKNNLQICLKNIAKFHQKIFFMNEPLSKFTFNTIELANYIAKLPNDYITLGGIKFHKIDLSDVIASYEEDRINLFDLYDLIECFINIRKMVTVHSRFDRLKKIN